MTDNQAGDVGMEVPLKGIGHVGKWNVCDFWGYCHPCLSKNRDRFYPFSYRPLPLVVESSIPGSLRGVTGAGSYPSGFSGTCCAIRNCTFSQELK